MLTGFWNVFLSLEPSQPGLNPSLSYDKDLDIMSSLYIYQIKKKEEYWILGDLTRSVQFFEAPTAMSMLMQLSQLLKEAW